MFDKEYIVTVGMDFAKKEVQIGESLVTAQFWDTVVHTYLGRLDKRHSGA